MNLTGTQSEPSGLEGLDPAGTGRVFWNLGTAVLCERAVARGEVRLSATGALAVTTLRGEPDLRLARVEDGEAGAPPASIARLTRDQFEALKADLLAYVARRTLFGQDIRVAAGPSRHVALRLLSDQAWHALAIRHLMAACEPASGEAPRLTILCAPGFHPVEETHGVRGDGVVALDLASGLALVAGTARSAAVRAALAHLLAAPLAEAGLLPLDGAVSGGPVTLFIGAPGSGKSTLAAGPTEQGLPVFDGALGWGDDGLVALETGRYARPADLAAAPDARQAAQSFGALLENVALDPARRTVDLTAGGADDARLLLPALNGGTPALGAPAHLFVLIRDESGALPALARLNPAQALGPLLSEAGRPAPGADSDRLRGLLERHSPACWLLNTGRIGDETGSRVPLVASRRLVDAARASEIADSAWRTDPHLGLQVPVAVEGVDAALLDPAGAWANRDDYAAAARRWAERFVAGRSVDEVPAEADGAAPSGMAVAAE
ncbi:phosphoenolpyruvate carboxykinase (ATP) [Ancylobacter sp. IITR112]|uniref:phosphoenolpyruvate carboxykinase (ATP) n=1 Tax=Ancylobacter sp. IITR112 TaxID=3138073 RepID=UPI00352B20C2